MAQPKKVQKKEPTIAPKEGFVTVIFETSQICKKGTEKVMTAEHADKLIKKGLVSYK